MTLESNGANPEINIHMSPDSFSSIIRDNTKETARSIRIQAWKGKNRQKAKR